MFCVLHVFRMFCVLRALCFALAPVRPSCVDLYLAATGGADGLVLRPAALKDVSVAPGAVTLWQSD